MDVAISPSPSRHKPGGYIDRKDGLRQVVNLILPDSLMITLALVMIPVVLVPLFVSLPQSLLTAFRFTDYFIIGVFAVEYIAKLLLAPDVFRHFISPWHLLDLLVVLIPLITLLPFLNTSLGFSSPLLRLLRIARVVAVGGRAIDRRAELVSPDENVEVKELPPMSVELIDGHLASKTHNVSWQEIKSYLASPSHTWVHFSGVSDADLEGISALLDMPRMLLDSEMTEESYPRVDYFDQFSVIFARVAEIEVNTDGASLVSVKRSGLLVVCRGHNIITISRARTGIFDRILEEARRVHNPDDTLAVTILYSILKYILEKDRQIIRAVEQQLMRMEAVPPRQRPPDFLERAFNLRKEVNQLVPSLLHLREIMAVITARRVALEGFSDRHEKVFGILREGAEYLHETASNARDNLQSLVDLHMNTTSFETNKVMRIIAVITSLGIVPALMGLLGSNIVGNPWNIQLWQVFGIAAVVMLALGWVFWRLGWLKG